MISNFERQFRATISGGANFLNPSYLGYYLTELDTELRFFYSFFQSSRFSRQRFDTITTTNH
ncbi:MAG: hypothetical protein ACFE0J_11735, partial [Elainellaceae cyanobacterium]